MSIGYRKPLSGPGKWVLRLHTGGKNNYVTETFATADDFSDADGLVVLDFWQAQNKAREQIVNALITRRACRAARRRLPMLSTAI